jgi:tRNA C32,U32 (ribose-2'-O)-methylase TrmJ
LPRRLPGPACDDSLRLQAEGFWNDTGVSSHTTRSVHAHQRARLKATDVSHGTTLEHGSIFPSGPKPENPPKRYSVENVQKNYVSLLFGQATSGNVDSTPLQRRNAAFIPMLERQGLSAAEIGKCSIGIDIPLEVK